MKQVWSQVSRGDEERGNSGFRAGPPGCPESLMEMAAQERRVTQESQDPGGDPGSAVQGL